ncbi:MCE family protein [Rhodococcus sp. HM1]|uniref:MCE family protein n=1 Tax=unclassified Rhodococcus (in: high G+C Gram-positive bacteria) TaxID=192944 RepID=UPI0018CF09E9|nr:MULTISPECIES: MCE family protein [unclassified Rhodococcus (in: high G+C Gram-positive bacteria)]MBH0121990.1 MCE family protein [Rhodococcus sp. CX]MCK8672406.1 MCE family protein [Rhodococcus sp. HM1]
MGPKVLRPLAGLAAIAVLATIVAGAAVLFDGRFTGSVRVTVLSPRAGLVMYPDAKVKMRDVTVGRVDSVTARPDGLAEITLALDPAQVEAIPSNVSVDIASTTVFGAKFVQFLPPDDPSPVPLQAGRVLESEHVTVEINTVFEQLVNVLDRIQPEKLNETLGAVAAAMNGRGDRFGQMLVDLDSVLGAIEPALPALVTDLALAPAVASTYAETAPDLITTGANAASIGDTVVDEEHNLDAFLLGMIGLSGAGQPVLARNRDGLTTLLDVLVPTTSLTDEYNEALTCSLTGLAFLADSKPVDVEGLGLSANFLWGTDPYRYPEDLPKVAASGGPQCSVLPVPYEGRPPFVVADVGADPFDSGRQAVTVEGLSEGLLGRVAGPGVPDPAPAVPFGIPALPNPIPALRNLFPALPDRGP